MKMPLFIFLALGLIMFPLFYQCFANDQGASNPENQESRLKKSGSNIVYIDIFIMQSNVEDGLPTSAFIPEPETEDWIKIFPNPNPGIFQIEMRLQQINQQVTIIVYNTSGKMVFQTRGNPSGNYLKEELDISFLPKGLYFVSVMEGVSRIVKQIIIQ